ncbi:unnamed protein product [Alopecurus aequalis]
MSISRAIGFISCINECVNLFQWAASSISSLRTRWSETQEKNIQDEVASLQRGLQRLSDTLPAMYGLIDRAEWRSHDNRVAEHLPILKDVVYDADDIIDEFRWHELNMARNGNAAHSGFVDLYKSTIQGSFNKVNDIQERLDYISGKLSAIPRINEVTPGFDRSLRPETISLPSEKEIFGRDKDLKQVMGLLGVPPNKSGGHPKRKRASSPVNASTSTQARNQVSIESREQAIPVLPIVGMGGVGKTTLAQHICNHPQVKSYFELIIWICADNFDVKRLTKDAIESSSREEAKLDHLDSLQHALSENLSNKRFLIVVDDVWDDALKENRQRWQKFCAPFRNVVHGSMMLVTTRSPKVADAVRTMEPFPLHGLTDDVLWNFFKLCAFGSETSNSSRDLERIGRSILPKLKGSPLAAKTLGRLLNVNFDTLHWENILKSELWELKQEETDILPALRLSYMYLPFHLKRCFSFCAVYPKDHKFEMGRLAEIWVAEGFVEPQGDTPLKDIGCQYFQDLFSRSFFQKVAGSYVIHDLVHDMAQLVSVHECFIIKSVSDFENVPQNVRHLYVLPNRDFDNSHLASLCKHTKLRTLLCKSYVKMKGADSVIGSWFGELRRMRVLLCASINKLPDSIGNLKHLRYLEITRACRLKSLPSEFCCLYNLQVFYAEKCDIESVPNDFNKLISLQSFKSGGFKYPMCEPLVLDAANGHGPGIRLIKNMNQFGELRIYNLGAISKDEAAEAKLKNKKFLHTLELDFSSSTLSLPKHNMTEMFEVLQPPTTSLEHLFISGYLGISLPTWFRPHNFLRLATLSIVNCGGLETFSRVSQNINLNETPDSYDFVDTSTGTSGIRAFPSHMSLTVSGCDKLSTLDDLLTTEHLPTVEKITIHRCPKLLSLPSDRFGSFHLLKDFDVMGCPCVSWQRGLVLPSSLQRLSFENCGNISTVVPSCLQNLALLVSLKICACRDLESIGGAEAIAKIESVFVSGCPKMEQRQIGGAEANCRLTLSPSTAT